MAVGEMLSEQARGGYGGGGYGGHGGGSYGASDYGYDYVDPYVVLASLGFGVFLFNIIYNLLNRSARSLDVSDLNLPLELSDRPERFHEFLENATQLHEHQSWTDDPTPESSHRLLLLKKSVRAGQRVADAIRRHPALCPKSLLCNLGNDEIAWNRQPAIVLRAMQLYITSLAQHYGNEDAARYVDQLEKDNEHDSDVFSNSCDASEETDCGLVDLMSLL